jgi:hypothetical protein
VKTEAFLIGEWWNPPGSNHDTTLRFLSNGEGSLKVVSLNENYLDVFSWKWVEFEQTIVFTPLNESFTNEFLRHSRFKLRTERREVAASCDRDVLILRVWLKGANLSFDDKCVEFDSGWSEVVFWRASVEDISQAGA